jgi:hypothetical protein
MRFRCNFVFCTVAVLAISIAGVPGGAQSLKLAPEGRGLLPKLAEVPTELGGIPAPHVFAPDPSGAFSRTIFETDADPDFKISIREYSFPPDHQKHEVAFPSGAFVHLLTGPGEATVANKKLDLGAVARTPLPAGAKVEITGTGDDPVIVRALIVEEK